MVPREEIRAASPSRPLLERGRTNDLLQTRRTDAGWKPAASWTEGPRGSLFALRSHQAGFVRAEIEQESRRTLEEMRQLVGVMRNDEVGSDNSPQPTLTHLEAMLARAKGADARLVVEGNPRVLPAGVELSAYRVVEHLLAALDDAPGVEVKVHFGDEALEIGVSGRPRKRATAEIERARERVRLHRGTLVATTRRGRAEAVASLPTLVGA